MIPWLPNPLYCFDCGKRLRTAQEQKRRDASGPRPTCDADWAFYQRMLKEKPTPKKRKK